MRPRFVLGGLLSEAWARSTTSYLRSLDYYNSRTKEHVQPKTSFINLFDPQQQNLVMITANLAYLLITMLLFIYMKKRQSLKLRWYLVIYDAINVALGAYIAISIIRYKVNFNGLLLCNSLSHDVEGYKIARIYVLFYLQKYFEFIDTWFFILRKSSRQVTFLHLFHHSSITIVVGTILPFDYNGDMYLPILLNSANHTAVYLHYLLASLGIASWWAPYITSMQLVQFCLIFGQSLLSYRVGPTCGSPDFAKVLMILYMGSLNALFGNYFLQKYIFRRPGVVVDMCGVVKSPAFEQDLTSEHCGTIELNEAGVGFVILPAHFPDPTYSSRHKGGPTGGVQPTALFQIVYSLTAVGTAMPHLHVLREVARLKSAADFTATVRGSGSGSVINPTISPTAVTNKSPYEKSNIKGQASKKITTSSSHEDIANGHTEHSGHAASVAPTGPGSDERVTSNRSSSPDDWWNAVRLEEITSSINKNSSGNANKAGRIPRASSTGNLPSAVSSALAGIPKAQSHSNLANSDRTVHNDRLIDGPLPLMGPNGLVESYRRRFRANKDASVVSSNDQIQNGSTSHLISATTATTATTSNLLNGGSPLMHNSESNESTDESTAVAPSPDGRRRPRPLCFFVAGGAPHGRVSWVVKTVPLSNSVIEAKAHNVYHDWRSIS